MKALQLLVGAIYIFENEKELKITPDDAMPGDWFGYSMALSGDTAVVGAPHHETGAVYVFQNNGTAWQEVDNLSLPSSDSNQFGFDVAISGDLILVGAANEDRVGDDDNDSVVLPDNNNSVHVYQKSATDNRWALRAKVTPSNVEYGDEFGQFMAISGNDMVFGSPYVNVDDDRGSIYTYKEEQF